MAEDNEALLTSITTADACLHPVADANFPELLEPSKRLRCTLHFPRPSISPSSRIEALVWHGWALSTASTRNKLPARTISPISRTNPARCTLPNLLEWRFPPEPLAIIRPRERFRERPCSSIRDCLLRIPAAQDWLNHSRKCSRFANPTAPPLPISIVQRFRSIRQRMT